MTSERPDVCFVSRKWPPAMGGMETYSWRLTEELNRYADVETVVLPGETDGSVPGPGKLLRFGLRAAWRLAFGKPHRIVQIADMASWPLGLAARLRAPRCRVVLTAHGTDVSFAFGPKLRNRAYRLYMRACAAVFGRSVVICNSRATCDMARQLGFSNLRCVPLGSDMAFRAGTNGQTRILFAGRLIPQKGCRWFIENVLPLLPDDIGLDVAGTCTNPQERAALDHPRVTYLGNLPQDELSQRYADALCVIVPNIDLDRPTFEGFGLVAAEAASAGGIVLAACHSGLRDAVIDGETGFHLPSGDAAAWAEKIRALAGWPPQDIDRFKRDASHAARAHFNWTRVAQETLDAYR